MTALRDYIRSYSSRPLVRPLALAGPILVLLISLPLLRPLRHPSDISNDEFLRLATIRALVERRSLAIEQTLGARLPRQTIAQGDHLYSPQPPMMAVLLSVPAWLMVKVGLSFDDNSLLIEYLLTVIGVTLPVAAASSLIYRMSRLFELRRPWRCGLAIAVVLGSGLISYAVVLNPHAPAAALVLGSAACLIHVAAVQRAGTRWIWMLLAGFCAGLAATLDPAAAILALLFVFVIVAMRFPLGVRLAGAALYLLGAAAPVAVQGRWNVPISGDWLPASLHQEFARGAHATGLASGSDVDDQTRGHWIARALLKPLYWLTRALVGSHGLLSHFPILIIGVAGVFAVMHRHWPRSTKTLAAATLVGSVAIVLLYCLWSADFGQAMFAARWFVLFVPMVLFWLGAWLRRSHSAAMWVLASILLAFSIVVSLAGASGPYPGDGFGGYTAASAAKRLFRSSRVVNMGNVLVENQP